MEFKRDKLLKTLIIVILPGGIPLYLGYVAYKLYKKTQKGGR